MPCQSKLQRENAGTSSWPSWISHFTGSFVGHSPSEMLCPPALFKKEKREEKRRKFYIYPDVTHTHTLALFLSRPRSATTPKAHIKCLYAPDEWLWPAGLPQAIKQSKTLCIPASSESSRIYRTVCYGMSVTICYRIYIYISGFLGPGIRCQKVASLRLN